MQQGSFHMYTDTMLEQGMGCLPGAGRSDGIALHWRKLSLVLTKKKIKRLKGKHDNWFPVKNTVGTPISQCINTIKVYFLLISYLSEDLWLSYKQWFGDLVTSMACFSHLRVLRVHLPRWRSVRVKGVLWTGLEVECIQGAHVPLARIQSHSLSLTLSESIKYNLTAPGRE